MSATVYEIDGEKYHILTEQLLNGRYICTVYPDPPRYGSGELIQGPPKVGDPVGGKPPREEMPGGAVQFASDVEAIEAGKQHVITNIRGIRYTGR